MSHDGAKPARSAEPLAHVEDVDVGDPETRSSIVNRPVRKHTHLSAKVADKVARSHKKPGKRTKRWKKALEAYKSLTE